MRSFGDTTKAVARRPVLVIVAAAVLAVTSFAAAARAQSSHAVELYKEATSREAALRRDLDAYRPEVSTAPLQTRVRVLVSAYEDLSRLFPASGYADNALWQGGMLAADSFWLFGEATDRATALRLLQALATRFPASSLMQQVAPQMTRLQRAAVAAPVEARTPRTPPASTAAPAAAPRAAATSSAAMLTAIRREVLPEALRITLELEREALFRTERLDGPARVFIDLAQTRAVEALKDATLSFPEDVVRQVRVGRQLGTRTRVVLDLADAGRYSVYALYNPYRIVLDFERVQKPKPTPVAPRAKDPARAVVAALLPSSRARATATALPSAPPRASIAAVVLAAPPGDESVAVTPPRVAAVPAPVPPTNNARGFSLSRQLGLGINRIVIDAGHGGRDPGAKVKGLTEAELVLDVALRLEKLLQKQEDVDVVLTRRDNTYVPLEERTALANRSGADLFLSIHANASPNAAARGIETYFLNFAPNKEAEAIAARENAGSSRTMSSLPDIVKAIALNDKINESRDFAAIVQQSLIERLRKVNKNVRSLGVKQAPFMVLIGATMPSILAEISFLTNGPEEALLKSDKYRQQIADALFNGILRYQQSLKRVPVVARGTR